MAVMRAALLLITLATTPGDDIPVAYDGPWRDACGDPAVWSDALEVGPVGTVRRVASGDRLELLTDSGSRVTFTLAGVKPARAAKAELASLALGKTAETLRRGDPDREVLTGPVHVDGKDVALQLLLSGAASFKDSKWLTSFNRCVYEKAEAAARQAHVGIWRTAH